MGSDGGMTAYERRRLENIKRNEEMLAALNVHSRLKDLSGVGADRKRAQSKSYKRSPVKKPKVETPVVLRRSLRTRGVPPDASTAGGLHDDFNDEKQIKKIPQLKSEKSFPEPKPIAMKDAYMGNDASDQKLIETINQCANEVKKSEGESSYCDSIHNLEKRKGFEVSVESFELKPENVARLVPGRIMSVRFFPTINMQMVVAGNKYGNIGLWNVNGGEGDSDGIYLYHPHPAPISGIAIDRCSINKMYTSCYDGFIRLMDVEREIFDLIYSSESTIYSMSLGLHNTKALYLGEGKGGIKALDLRAGKPLLTCDAHGDRINTIDFTSKNDNIMATGSTDGTASIWDLRCLNANKPTPLGTVAHKRAVHSAYFSPSGKFLATTSLDDNVGLASGANYEDVSMVHHNNQTGRWISTFRGIWGWDDSAIFIGNMKRGVDVISVAGRKTVATLESDLVSAIPSRFDAHPCSIGTLAGATAGGQVYIWTQS
ncbi:uncharacterized protein LOC127263398 [Andrographis paniculata]|uniref:uncharacterized protein LOC127263398 n=1 Tax=Andrographis paniculata TaxID=175694 RepID=UPI0021E783FC|nr:uncharacterized protein LOC127263398 [Andrographis paniculata]